jgi:integrase
MDKEVELIQFRRHLPEVLRAISASSEEVALYRPLFEVVQAAITATCRSAHTARSYRYTIAQFLLHFQEENKDRIPEVWLPLAAEEIDAFNHGEKSWQLRGPAGLLRLVNAALVDSFKAKLDEKLSAASVANRIGAVRSFLRVAFRDRVLTYEQAGQMGLKAYELKLTRSRPPVGRRLSADEVATLRSAVDASRIKGIRDRAIIDALLYLALRREELCGLRLSHFVQDKGSWWVIISGKGEKKRKLKVSAELLGSILPWLDVAMRKSGLATSEKPLFTVVRKSGVIEDFALDPSVISRMVCGYGAAAGIAPDRGKNILSPHDLRRTAARAAYDAGASLVAVQNFLGHADVKTTTAYIGAYEDEKTAGEFLKW